MGIPRPFHLLAAPFLALITGSTCIGADPAENPALAKLFEGQRVTGTFVLLNVESGEFTFHNAARANTPFIPASTFKIPNTLIGLETRAVSNVDEVLPYGGRAFDGDCIDG